MKILNTIAAFLSITFGASTQTALTQTYSAYDPSSFIQLENGDFALTGRGSVTDELTAYGIDVAAYLANDYDSTYSTLMVGVNENLEVYFYIYNAKGYLDYDRCSIGYFEGDLTDFDYDNLTYFERTATLVGFDSTGTISKYLVSDLNVSATDDYVILVRQIYNYENRENTEFVQGIGILYQYDHDKDMSLCNQEDTIAVTDKLVAYEIYPYYDDNDVEGILQRNYVAFTLDRETDDLLKVKLKYDGYYWGGYENVTLGYSGSWASALYEYNFSDCLVDNTLLDYVTDESFKKLYEFNDYEVIIEPLEYNYSKTLENKYSRLSWIPVEAFKDKTESYSFNFIEKTSTLDTDKVVNDDIFNYEYIVTFDAHGIDCCFNQYRYYVNNYYYNYSIGGVYVGMYANTEKGAYLSDGNIATYQYNKRNALQYYGGNYGDSVTTLLDDEQLYYSDYTSAVLEVQDLTFLEFTYEYQGEIKHAIAVDSYTNSSGAIQIQNPDVEYEGFRDKLWKAIVEWWNSIVDTLGTWWYVICVVFGIIAIIFILWVVLSLINLIVSLFK